jgi:hypothetical protein
VLCASVLAATARAASPPSFFDGAGVFVDNPGNLPGPWGLAATLEANHFTWIAFQVDNGLVQSDIPPIGSMCFGLTGSRLEAGDTRTASR